MTFDLAPVSGCLENVKRGMKRLVRIARAIPGPQRMRSSGRSRAWAACVALHVAACAPAEGTQAGRVEHGGAAVRSAPVAPGKPRLARGVNFGNALDAPNEGEWGVTLSATDFAAVKRAGFDHVRLPVRFSAHASTAAPYAIDPVFFARVDWAIEQALRSGLAVLVDFHHYEELMHEPGAHRERFVALWSQIAARYRGQPDAVCFEPLNEPSDKLTRDVWNPILADALRVIRAQNPTRTVVVEGVDWASAENLRDSLVVPDSDPNLVGSFHMYQPILFTHQGAPWMTAEYQTTGVVFPGPPAAPIKLAPAASAMEWVREWFERYDREPAATNPSGPTTVSEQLDMAAAWAGKHGLRVYMGEFGADDVGDAKSRAAWTRLVRTEAERRGFGWAYWDDGGSFKAYDRATDSWVPYLKAALLE